MELPQVLVQIRNRLICMTEILCHKIEVSEAIHTEDCVIELLNLTPSQSWLVSCPTQDSSKCSQDNLDKVSHFFPRLL